MARGLKFRIWVVEGLYYRCSENKGADQLRGNREADLRLFRICKKPFSHDAAHFSLDLLDYIIPFVTYLHFNLSIVPDSFSVSSQNGLFVLLHL